VSVTIEPLHPNQAPSVQLPWMSTTVSADVNTTWGPVTAQVDAGSVHSDRFAAWLALPTVGAMSSLSPLRIELEESSRNLDNPSNWLDALGYPAVPAQRWLFGDTTALSDPAPAAAMLYVSLDTTPSNSIFLPCGRVHFGSFHAAPKGDTSERLFPAECDETFSPNEKAVAFLLLDLTSCMTGIGHECDTIPKGLCDLPMSCEDACGTNSAGKFNCRPVERAEYTTTCLYDDGMGGVLQCYCLSP